MTNSDTRELDAWVAEHVMGWVWCRYEVDEHEYAFILKPPDKVEPDNVVVEYKGGTVNAYYLLQFSPTTNSIDDYEVLKHVRENWDRGPENKFLAQLRDQVNERRPFGRVSCEYSPLYYEPGDYSRAAKAAMEE